MKQIVIINGPAGVGKTTISRQLAKDFQNSVVISGDSLKNFIVNKSKSVKGRMGYKNGASLITNFIDAGYEFVVFEYIFPSRKQIDYLIKEIEVEVEVSIFTITLWAELEIIKKRESERENREPLNGRVDLCFKELKSNYHDFKNIINTNDLSPQVVVDEIKNWLQSSRRPRQPLS